MERNARPSTWVSALALAAGAAAVVLLWRYIAPVLTLVCDAAALAFLLEPLARRLEKGLGRGAAAGLSLLAALLALAAFVWLLVPPLVRQAADLLAALPQTLAALRAMIARLSEWSVQAGLGRIELPPVDLTALGARLPGFFLGTVNFAGSVAGAVSQATMAAVLSVFLLADRERLILRLELVIPLRLRNMAVRMGSAARRELRLYLRGQATISLAVGALSAFGLWLAGVRSALVLGVLIGVLNLIPYFGPVLGAAPALAAALTSGWQTALFAACVLIVVQQLDGMLISPRVMGSLTGLSPAAVLVGVFAGGCLGGMPGMLLALPAMMVFRTCVRVFVQRGENI